MQNSTAVHFFDVVTSGPKAGSRLFCPACHGHNIRRQSRIYGPFSIEFCHELPVLYPRVSSSNAWWNQGLVSWLVRPPDYESPNEWYIVKFYLRCRDCSYHWHYPCRGNTDGEGRRKFGRGRLWIFWSKDFFHESLEKIGQP